MATERIIPGEIRIFLNHIYEFKKGVRNMVLYTMSREHEEFAIRRLKNQKISYMIQEVGTNKINLFFGKPECMEAMRHIIIRPLNQLSAKRTSSWEPCWDTTFANNANGIVIKKKV